MWLITLHPLLHLPMYHLRTKALGPRSVEGGHLGALPSIRMQNLLCYLNWRVDMFSLEDSHVLFKALSAKNMGSLKQSEEC